DQGRVTRSIGDRLLAPLIRPEAAISASALIGPVPPICPEALTDPEAPICPEMRCMGGQRAARCETERTGVAGRASGLYVLSRILCRRPRCLHNCAGGPGA